MTGLRFLIFGIGLAASLAMYGHMAQAVEYTENSATALSGQDRVSGVHFSVSGRRSGKVTALLRLPGGKIVSSVVDYENEDLGLKVAARGGTRPSTLNESDKLAIARLSGSLEASPSPLSEPLNSILSLLSEAPLGIDIDRTPSRTINKAVQARGAAKYKSLCGVKTATAVFNMSGRKHTSQAKVGPCYNSSNQCLGRCGAGCGNQIVAGVGNPAAVQRFTQECLNHDLCTGANGGKSFGECKDEWDAAVNGFIFAPDCASATGIWESDVGSSHWDLTQLNDAESPDRYVVSGLRWVSVCGRYAVSGTHIRDELVLFERKTGPSSCGSFGIFKLKMKTCDTAEGSWNINNGGDIDGYKMHRRPKS